jgi:hypothetical protein
MKIARLVIWCLACLPGLAAACPQAVPAGLTPAVVAERVEVDGMQLSILHVRGKEDVATLLARVETGWKRDGYEVKRSNPAGWNVLSALSERCLTTLQLVDQGGTAGYFAINPLKRVGTAAAPLAPPGSRVLSSVRSEDDGRKGTITALESQLPIEKLIEYYLRRLQADDWQAVRADGLANRNLGLGGAIISAQRGRERIEVLMWGDGATQIVINQADTL